MSPARFLAAAVAIYGLAISVGVVLYLVFRDSLEGLSEGLRRRLADLRGPVRSGSAGPLRFRAPQIWESASVGVGSGPRQRLLQFRARAAACAGAARTPVPGRLVWAVLSVVALAAATAVGATHDFGSGSRTGSRAAARLQSGPWDARRLLRPPRTSSTRTAVTHVHASLTKRAASPARQSPPAERTHVRHIPVVSNLQPVSDHTAPIARTTVTAAAPQAGGPTPLRAPKSGSAPSPLRAP